MTLSLPSTLALQSPRRALAAAKISPDTPATLSSQAVAPAVDTAALLRESASAWGLTRRERDILRLTLLGLTNRQMAAELLLTRKTIEAHVTSLLKKAKARNRNELVAKLLIQQG